jgi:hypothetical protein
MKRKKKPKTLRLAVISVIAALSYQALGKLGPTDALSQAWQMPLERNLSRLRVDGELPLENTPWADAPWRASTGGPLNRYKRQDLTPEERHRQPSPSLERLQKLSAADLARSIELLSPAELFDLVRKQTRFPLAQEIKTSLRNAARKGDSSSFDEKMNFGWAAAATTFREPDAIRGYSLRLPPRIVANITLGSSDLKAIIAYYYGVKASDEVRIAKVGNRCQGLGDTTCERIDPASFHILLANMIHEDGKSFVIDIDPSAGVNYRPIVAFQSDIRRGRSENEVEVYTLVEYVRSRAPQSEPYGIFNADHERVSYRYSLTLDAKQNILSGRWISEARPEFAWRTISLPHVDRDGFSTLKPLYRPASIAR